MGMLQIKTWGSFKGQEKTFTAMTNGHAHAVAEAIAFLAKEVLPAAIVQDHDLQKDNCYPENGFKKPDK